MFNIMFISALIMFFMFFFSFMLSLMMFYLDLAIISEWMIMSFNSMNLEMYLLFDWISLLFMSVVFLISSMIMIYSYEYMSGEVYINRFIYLVILFILSMILMIISPNYISILFGWDGLGLVSYCLVIYYQNYVSYNSGMVTVLCNRIGDVGLLMGIGLLFINGSWSICMLNYYMNLLVVGMLLLAAITKSAQMPFSTWLPMAMAAPTPVSALVHSSTLVTAGVYLMIRFNNVLMISQMNILMFFLSVLTMFMAGLMALVENDLKKIIALSTLSQLGLMMMILSCGYYMMAFFHLLTHAIFKSLLFMCAGIIIHGMGNTQDIRLMGNLNEMIPFTMISFFISSMALSGFPFLAGFYSKDLIMEIIYSLKINGFMLMFIILSLMLTVSYSIRLFYYMFFLEIKFYSFINFKENFIMNISMMVLIILSIKIGSLMSWMFFFDVYVIHLKLSVKFITLSSCLMGVMVTFIMMFKNFVYKFYYLSYFLSSMWFLNYMYMWIYKPLNVWSSSIYKFDKGWMEFLGKMMLFNLIKHSSGNFYYRIYMFIYVFVSMLMILVLIW